jgi:hypothetical protein
MEVNTSDTIAILSLFISFGAAVFAKSSSNKFNQIAQQNLNLQFGMVELEISQSIENAKSDINKISIIMAPLVSKENLKTITPEESETITLYRKNFNAATQTLINYYDSACSKYSDGKVDKIRFKETLHNSRSCVLGVRPF